MGWRALKEAKIRNTNGLVQLHSACDVLGSQARRGKVRQAPCDELLVTLDKREKQE